MTPAINLAKKHKIEHVVHEYSHDPASHSYGLEAVEKLGLNAAQVFKTLVVTQEPKGLAVAVVPVAGQLNLKAMAKALKVKRVVMAAPADVERSSGYVLGGISPLGQKRLLPTVVDESAATFDSIYVSAGRRGLEIELAVLDLLALTGGRLASIALLE
ncbi:Cys-tRNA(Pro) deacylase [Zhongshania guokunii]|uniref:Cys-tRNA(Pro)/Cys-tRNA(Cys) deacylase n=1 Tax=Zhongshania guokunii TaxID=641783 RepID=A0ABV3UA21_9GAMM